jgi:hypothetical protein
VPSRLLDVRRRNSEADMIRLVERSAVYLETTRPELTYATLSYVWGVDPQIKLVTSRYEKFKDGIKIEDIPQCFSDAISITRRMGVSYLWIDSLW